MFDEFVDLVFRQAELEGVLEVGADDEVEQHLDHDDEAEDASAGLGRAHLEVLREALRHAQQEAEALRHGDRGLEMVPRLHLLQIVVRGVQPQEQQHHTIRQILLGRVEAVLAIQIHVLERPLRAAAAAG